MGNVQAGDGVIMSNIATTVSQLIHQLNTLFLSGSSSGPIAQFALQLNSRLAAIRSDILAIQANEASSANLASVNSSINNLNALMQTVQNDILSLQNQSVDALNLQEIQTTMTNISNDLLNVQSTLGSVNVVNLSALVTSLNTQLTALGNLLSSKVDRSTSVNGKQLSTNIVLSKSDLGLAHVSNDAQLKRAANDYRSFPVRSVITANDMLLLEDSEVGGSKYTAPASALPPSSIVLDNLASKVDKLELVPATSGGPNKTVTITTNSDGQITSATENLINITPAQANLGNVVNSDTTNIANTFIRSTFMPINSVVVVNDSGLNAIQKLQGQINARLVPMRGATSVANGVVGLVPAPVINQGSAFLRGDGVWADNTMAVASVSAAVNPAATNTIYLANTSGGAFNITLPAPSVSGVKIVIVDANNNFQTHPVGLIPQVGGLVNGSNSPMQLKNQITSLYFSLPNKWIVEHQVTGKQVLSQDTPVIVAPNPTLSNNSYATVGTLPTVFDGSSEVYDIAVQAQYSAIDPADPYVVTLSLTIVDDGNNSVVSQASSSVGVIAATGTSVYSVPLYHRFYTSVGASYRLRVDAQITGGAVVNLSSSAYDFSFTYRLVGQ